MFLKGRGNDLRIRTKEKKKKTKDETLKFAIIEKEDEDPTATEYLAKHMGVPAEALKCLNAIMKNNLADFETTLRSLIVEINLTRSNWHLFL